MINAGKESITGAPGFSIARSSETFGMMRDLHLHITMYVWRNKDFRDWGFSKLDNSWVKDKRNERCNGFGELWIHRSCSDGAYF